MKDNMHTAAIPADVLAQAQTKADELADILKPYLLALTPDERRALPKMGEKTIAFVEKARDFASQNPNLRPPYLVMSEFDVDLSDARGLRVLANTVCQIHDNIDDTEMLAGSEAYQAALVFYQSVKMAAAQDVPGAKAVYEELKKRFPQRRGKGEAAAE